MPRWAYQIRGQHNPNEGTPFHKAIHIPPILIHQGRHTICSIPVCTGSCHANMHDSVYCHICQHWHTGYICRPETVPYMAQLTYKSEVPLSMQVWLKLVYDISAKPKHSPAPSGKGGGEWRMEE